MLPENWKKWLGTAFGKSTALDALASTPAHLHEPESIVWPGDKAPLLDHVRFLLEAKRFVANHEVPEDRRNANNQYSHSKQPTIGDNFTHPATTNCSYEYYGRKFISIGFPLFVKQAPLIKDNGINSAFNGATYWDSFERLLNHHIGDLGDGDTKYGFSRPTNHYYIEKPVPDDVAEEAQPIIDFFTRTDLKDPGQFLSELSQRLKTPDPGAPRPRR